MDKFVTVATFNLPAQAEAQKLFLQTEGIQAFLTDDNPVGMDWLLSNAVGGVTLQVAAADADRTIQLLERFRALKTIAPRIVPRLILLLPVTTAGRPLASPRIDAGTLNHAPIATVSSMCRTISRSQSPKTFPPLQCPTIPRLTTQKGWFPIHQRN